MNLSRRALFGMLAAAPLATATPLFTVTPSLLCRRTVLPRGWKFWRNPSTDAKWFECRDLAGRIEAKACAFAYNPSDEVRMQDGNFFAAQQRGTVLIFELRMGEILAAKRRGVSMEDLLPMELV